MPFVKLTLKKLLKSGSFESLLQNYVNSIQFISNKALLINQDLQTQLHSPQSITAHRSVTTTLKKKGI